MTRAGLLFVTETLLLLVVVLSFGEQLETEKLSVRIGAFFPHGDAVRNLMDIFRPEDAIEQHFEYIKFEVGFYPTSHFEVSKAICTAISKRPFALFGLLDASTLVTLTDFMNALNMPYITISNPTGYNSSKLPRHQNNDFILYMRPAYDKALIDVIVNYKWPKIFYIFDSSEGFYHLEQFREMAKQLHFPLEIKPVKLSNVNDSYKILRYVDSSEPDWTNKYVVLDLSTNEVLLSILKQIQLVGMNKKEYHYLLGGIAFDEIDVSDFMHGGMNITGFSLFTKNLTLHQSVGEERLTLEPVEWPKPGSRLKLDALLSMDSATVLTKAFASLLDENKNEFSDVKLESYVGASCRSNLTQPWKKGDVIMKHLKRMHFWGKSGLVSFDDRGYRKNYSLAVYKLSLNADPQNIGVWSDGKGLIKADDGTVNLPPESKNRKLIVTSIISPPFLMLKPNALYTSLDGMEQFEGYCVDLIAKLAQQLNLDIQLKLVADGKYGMENTDGTWNGMIGELITRQADIAVAPLTITSLRERVIDFSKPFMNVGISIMIKNPGKQSPGVFYFLDRFEIKIWLLIIVSYLAASFVLFLVDRFCSYSWQLKEVKDGNVDGLTSKVIVPNFKNKFTILNSFWFALGALMRQRCCVYPRSLSGRVVSSVWWLFSTIVIALYIACVMASYVRESRMGRLLVPIESADDLTKQNVISYGTLEGGSTKNFFKTSKVAVYENMWNNMSQDPRVFMRTTGEGVERVRASKGKYAFLLESVMNDYYNKRKPCNTMKVGKNLDSKGYGIATPIGSPLRSKINRAIMVMIENGFLAKLYQKWWIDKGECKTELAREDFHARAIRMKDMAGLFYILLAGLALSIVVFTVELFYKLKNKKAPTETPQAESIQKQQLRTSSAASSKEALPAGSMEAANQPITAEAEESLPSSKA